MAFFDDIGKKITQTGQSALQKTKELADVTRLNDHRLKGGGFPRLATESRMLRLKPL